MNTTNPMKNQCLFGDICPCEDCEECSDYTPVDVYGEPEVDLSQHKRMALKEYVMMIERMVSDY